MFSFGLNPWFLLFLGCLFAVLGPLCANEERVISEAMDKILAESWDLVFEDDCTQDWSRHWMLDGNKASIYHSEQGMELQSGPVAGENASHAVLWTQQRFEGDVRIEYDYTRLDNVREFVNILYILATGSGEGAFDADISKWNHLREVPEMGMYFNHMNLYHISYAAYELGNDDRQADYIRARHYMPLAGKGLHGTELEPDYERTGLFAHQVPHHFVVIKSGNDLFMRVTSEEGHFHAHWRTDKFPPITEGRVGLRQMWTRAARYGNFKVFTRPASTAQE